MSSVCWTDRLAVYDKLVAMSPNFERKGKAMPFTSANGYMFSQLNKAGELGIRLAPDQQERFTEEHNTTPFTADGAGMKGSVLVPYHLLEDLEALSVYLNDSYAYVTSLEPK